MSTQAIPAEATLAQRVGQLEADLAALKAAAAPAPSQNSVAILCFSGDWDRLLAAFNLANGALAMGCEVHMFFTFWGASAIRNGRCLTPTGKSWIQRMLGRMLPRGAGATPLSRMGFAGASKMIFRRLMRRNGVADLPDLVQQARELGAKFYCCDTSLRLFGWSNEDLMEGDDSRWCGAATFLGLALKSRVTLFV